MDPLCISLIPPDTATLLVAGKAWKVYLQGSIDSEAPKRLAGALESSNVKHGFALIDSSGGNLHAGMEIGRLIRNHGLSTYVRKCQGETTVPGRCLSAAVFAFVGGYFRYLEEKDVIGIHRFSTDAPSQYHLDDVQIVAGSITAYLTEMGVDVRLFERMTLVPRDQIRTLSVDEAIKLKVANNGFGEANWSIEALDEGLYLRGMQDAWYGMGKVTFVCGSKAIVFYPFYEGGANSEAIASTSVRHSVRLDDEFIDIGSPLKPLTVREGFVSAPFVLPSSLVERIKTANSVGYAAHPANPDVFWGFKIDIGKGRQKVASYFTQCLASRRAQPIR